MGDARSIMAGSGPEDYYVLHPVKSTSTFATAGPDYVLRYTKPRAPLDFPDQDDHDRFRKVASDFRDGAGPADVLLKLDMDRSLCPQARLAHELCKATKYEHQKARACMATWQEFSRCQVKLTRAVDTLCRSQFTTLTTCLEGGDASKCVKPQVAFDVCTEDF